METRTESTIGSTGWQGNPEDGDGGDDCEVRYDDNEYDNNSNDLDDACRSQSVMPGGGGSLNPLSRR